MNARILIAGVTAVAGIGIGIGTAVASGTGAGAGPALGQGGGHPPTLSDLSPTITKALSQLPSQSTMVATLQRQGVGVTVSGTSLPLAAISSHTLGYMTDDIESAGTSAADFGGDVGTAVAGAGSPTQGLRQAVAFETLQQLLYDAATSQGQVASTQAAQAYAQQNYDAYVESYDDPSPYTPALPPPHKRAFLSAAAIGNYRFSLTVDQEMDEVIGAGSGQAGDPGTGATDGPATGPADGTAPTGTPSSSGPGGSGSVNGTPALQAWMTAQLTTVPVVVSGIPGVTTSNLPSFLPPGLDG